MNYGVSIVVNCHNHENLIGAAIESALAQDYRPLQVIVVDDGSTDRTPEVVNAFGKRVEAVFQENQKQVAAIKNALPLVKHDIVIVLDGDDLLDPHAVSTVMSVWREGVVKVQYPLRIIDEHGVANGNVFPKYTSGMTPEMMHAETLRTGSYPDSPTSGNAYHRRLMQDVLPLVQRSDGFDGELNVMASLYGDVVTIVEPLGCYRIHGRNNFSQARLEIEKFGDYVRHCEEKAAFAATHFLAKGYAIDDDALDRDVKYLEYRLVLEKLGQAAPETRPRLLRVAWNGLCAAWTSPYALKSRLLRMTWIAAIALAPKDMATSLIEQRFVPGRRKPWITRLVKLGRRFDPASATPPNAKRNLMPEPLSRRQILGDRQARHS